MNIYVYSDESGVFDKAHNDYFVFGGLIFLDKESRDIATREYIHAERTLRNSRESYKNISELKACKILNKDKNKLYRSLNKYYQFGVVINQKYVLDRIFDSKKDKQRYLDYVYKIAVKRCLRWLIRTDKIIPNEVHHMYFYIDEHSTATNGKYELQENLEQEFKLGTYNSDYSVAFPPIFTEIHTLEVYFCDSKSKPLIRAADIIANNIYYKAVSGKTYINTSGSPFIIEQP